jgi:hypothetical protein
MDLSGIFRGLVGPDGFRAGDKSLWKKDDKLLFGGGFCSSSSALRLLFSICNPDVNRKYS